MVKKTESFTLAQVQELVTTAVSAAVAEATKNGASKRDINRGAFWKSDDKAKFDFHGLSAVHVQCPHCEEVATFSGFLYKQPKSGNKPRFTLSLAKPTEKE